MKFKSVDIRSVAEHAGVSIATVSRAVNKPTQVRELLRKRIEASIQTLGYIPDAAARSLSSRKTLTIGAIIPTVDNAMFARGIDALQRYLTSQGYLLLLATHNYDPEVEFQQVHNMVSRGIDGLILRGDVHTDALRNLLAAQRIPFINVGVYQPNRPWPCVGADNEQAGWQACRFLISLGHTRIGMVAARSHNNDRASARVDGVRRALNEAGLNLPAHWYTEVPYRMDDARQAARALLQKADQPTALICGNDVIAYGVLAEAALRGINVPQQLSVMGFDDLEWSRHQRPALTTMHMPIDEVWTRGGEYIVNTLSDCPVLKHHEVQASLIVRESTARPG
jgi:LacI family transcriptional regulator